MEKIICSTADLAEFLNTTSRTIQRLVKNNVLTKHKNGYGKFDLKENTERYYKYRLDAEKKKYDSSSKEIKRLRFRKEAAEAELKEIELEEKKGELVDKQKFEKQFFKLVRSARDAILNIPNRIGDIIAAESDSNECKKIIREEIRQALNEFGNKL